MLENLEITVDVETAEGSFIAIEAEIEVEISAIPEEEQILNLKIIDKIKVNAILVGKQAIQEQIHEIIQELEDVKIGFNFTIEE